MIMFVLYRQEDLLISSHTVHTNRKGEQRSGQVEVGREPLGDQGHDQRERARPHLIGEAWRASISREALSALPF